jgi:class 3 adenylate cyclase
MTWRSRRRGVFEEPPRVLYRRTGARYIDACALAIVVNGVVVAGFGVVTLALYVDLRAAELSLFAACSAAGYAVEGLVAAVYLRRAALPARAWLAGEDGEDSALHAWSAAAQLPLALLRRRSLYAIGAVGAGAADLLLAALLDLPAYEAALLFPTSYLLYLSSVVLRYVALELGMRPLLEAIGESLQGASPLDAARVSLHRRLLAAVPMVNWGAGVVVAGLLTENTRDLDTIGLASVVGIAVTAAISIWLSLVLADAVSGPIIDLRDATRRVAAGDLSVRVPVVSTDETGELAESFNAMVVGLGERERLRDAFGAFVDPALTERVLAEGTDLRGEEVEVSVLFLDVREFTAFAESAAAHEVVATLNNLYEAVVPVILRHGGHVDKFMGDGLLAVFGAPERQADHAARAVAAAREIVQLVRHRLGGKLRVGVGVNSGRVVVGTIGGGGRRDFTVIGDPVNTAARVEAATRVTGDDILITESTLRALGRHGEDFEERPSAPLKGKAATVRLYAPRPDAKLGRTHPPDRGLGADSAGRSHRST